MKSTFGLRRAVIVYLFLWFQCQSNKGILCFSVSPGRAAPVTVNVAYKTHRIHRIQQGLSRRFQNRESYNYYDDYYDSLDEDQRVEKDDYWYEEKQSLQQQSRGGMYKVYFDSSAAVDPKETQLDWEICSNGENEALVLLPPEAVERPTAVLHFVGGTFFGSLPKVWYGSLLEGIVRNTQCAIVITPIPVTLLKSPLQHVSLARKLRSSFEYAWSSVLEDEYSDLSDVPVCGLGHSLGARLLVVMTTLSKNKVGTIPSFKSFILISFTNFGAEAGIPGVSALLKETKKQERTSQVSRERERRKNAQKSREKRFTDGSFAKEGDEEDDEEWGELIEDLQQLLKEQASRVRNALTPDSRDLEFNPSPEQLWKAIRDDRRYAVPKTLLVQFDDDVIDQSSKLAHVLHDTNSSEVHFARLRGAHLTPVSVDRGDDAGWFGLTSKTSVAVWKAIKGRDATLAQDEAMRDLRQSICRYISDVVTK